jgi:hypothetical protein
MRIFFDAQGWWVFILHSIFSLLLIIALYRLGMYVLRSERYTWVAMLVLLFPFMYRHLGTVELYNNGFTPAESIAAWSIVYWLNRKILTAYLLAIIATALHPIIGLHTFILITSAYITTVVFEKQRQIQTKYLGIGVICYVLLAGSYLLLIFSRMQDTVLSKEEFFTIFFSFRNAHHYLPSEFSKESWFTLAPLYLLCPVILYKVSKELFFFSLFILAGCIIYTIAVEVFHSTFIASTQWYKSTIWLEYLAILTCVWIAQKILTKLNLIRLQKSIVAVTIAGCITWIALVFPSVHYMETSTTYEFPFFTKRTDEIDISLKAKELTPTNALFIHPCSFSALKTYGQRSSFVEFKAITHKKSFFKEWGNRFCLAYSLDYSMNAKGLGICQLADTNYRNYPLSKISLLTNETGITHLITFADVLYPLPIVAKNESYVLYDVSSLKTSGTGNSGSSFALKR